MGLWVWAADDIPLLAFPIRTGPYHLKHLWAMSEKTLPEKELVPGAKTPSPAATLRARWAPEMEIAPTLDSIAAANRPYCPTQNSGRRGFT